MKTFANTPYLSWKVTTTFQSMIFNKCNKRYKYLNEYESYVLLILQPYLSLTLLCQFLSLWNLIRANVLILLKSKSKPLFMVYLHVEP